MYERNQQHYFFLYKSFVYLLLKTNFNTKTILHFLMEKLFSSSYIHDRIVLMILSEYIRVGRILGNSLEEFIKNKISEKGDEVKDEI